MLIDDFRRNDFISCRGTRWRGISDRVMGGVSELSLCYRALRGRRCLQLAGQVRLENNGGFVQMALDLDPEGGDVDASSFTGLRLLVLGNDQRYAVHLRTADVSRPWQSYRAQFDALPQWQEVKIPFRELMPHRIDAPLDLTRVRRLGLVAIGRAFQAELAVAEIAFYA